MNPDPDSCLLPFSASDPAAANGDGRPWGDGTAMSKRAGHSKPYDAGCRVTPLIGGYAAMSEILAALRKAITDGPSSGKNFGERGFVYISDWRLNAQRDLSSTNSWGTHHWSDADTATSDETVLGLLFKLMQAGVKVRVMLWLPTLTTKLGAGAAHVQDHYYIAKAVAAQSDLLASKGKPHDPIGVVALDARTAEGSIAGAHHQKTIVVRGPTQDIAFCGGVDPAFTRRDAPADPTTYDATKPRFLDGDWQSNGGVPALAPKWPPTSALWPVEPPPDTLLTRYAALAKVEIPKDVQQSDLPGTESDPPSRNIYGMASHIWHDQHLKLEGPIVQTLEDQFGERWQDTARVYSLADPSNIRAGQVIFSSPDAFDATTGAVSPLPASAPAAAAPGATSTVQMLRTIPWRDARTAPPFRRAEFTVLGEVARAVNAAQELVWIFDQYFWSEPLARLLNHRVSADGSHLCVIVVLPPYADTRPSIIHEARRRALSALTDGVPSGRIGVYNLWDPRGQGRGIYCHAKMQTYDGALMICGSANMNRRSFMCDSEIACAVLDQSVVSTHQQRLWQLLFNAVPSPAGDWPGPKLDDAGSGQRFLTAFTKAAQDAKAYVRPDPWASSSPALPNGVPLPRGGIEAGAAIDRIFDPTSLNRIMESYVWDKGSAIPREPRLDDIARRIETCVRLPGGTVITPWRMQS